MVCVAEGSEAEKGKATSLQAQARASKCLPTACYLVISACCLPVWTRLTSPALSAVPPVLDLPKTGGFRFPGFGP